MSIYCKGEKQGECFRRLVGRSLGGPDKIPPNMMPNGHALTGTDDSGWPTEVKMLLAKKRAIK